MDSNPLVFLVAVLIVGILLFLAISMTKKRKHSFDKENYQIDFLRIENSLEQGNEATYSMAIIQGDKLLDKAMCEMGGSHDGRPPEKNWQGKIFSVEFSLARTQVAQSDCP